MNRYKVYDNSYKVYFSTCSIMRWLPVFNSPEYFAVIIDSLKYCQANKGLKLMAYVIMPDHLHMVTSSEEDKSLSDIMRDFKRFTSKAISTLLKKECRIYYLKVFRNYAKLSKEDSIYKVWRDDFYPKVVYSEKFLRQKIDYIHYNPVRKGLVEKPEEWLYSSARNYLLEDNTIIELDDF